MSSPEVTAPATVEPIAQPAASTEEASAAPTDLAAEIPVTSETAADAQPAVEAPEQEATEVAPVGDEVKPEEEKKDKKPARKPFADLLSKILKPHPHEKPAADKKQVVDASAPTIEEPVSAPVLETPAENTEVAGETLAETSAAEETTKDASSPRKERGNIFEKLTALVMKPKSPKPKKSDVKEESDEAPAAEAIVEPLPSVEATPASPAAEVAESIPADVPAVTEAAEEPKVDKKEKTPKDLAKLARRFSGRLFGVEKKKDTTKRPEPTPEEAEESAKSVAPTVIAVAPATAPQLPVEAPSTDPSPETPQTMTDSAPVIAAAA